MGAADRSQPLPRVFPALDLAGLDVLFDASVFPAFERAALDGLPPPLFLVIAHHLHSCASHHAVSSYRHHSEAAEAVDVRSSDASFISGISGRALIGVVGEISQAVDLHSATPVSLPT